MAKCNNKKDKKTNVVKVVFFVMGLGVLISIVCLGFSVANAILLSQIAWLNITSLIIASIASILSFVLSGVATYLSDKSSKKTETTLNEIEETFKKYINYISGTNLQVGNADIVIRSITEDKEEKKRTTPVAE